MYQIINLNLFKLLIISYVMLYLCRCLEWIRRSGDISLLDMLPPKNARKQRRVCSLHFPDSAFRNSFKNTLTCNAIPNFYNEGTTTSNSASKDDKTSVKEPESSSKIEIAIPSIAVTKEAATASQNFEINNETSSLNASKTDEKTFDKKDSEYYLDLSHRMQMRKEILDLKFRLQGMTEKCGFLRKQLLKKEAQLTKAKEIIPKQKFLSEIEKYIKGAPSVFVNMQFKRGKHPEWLPPERDLASFFYETSPLLYKKMINMGFKLPTISTVQSWQTPLNELSAHKDGRKEIKDNFKIYQIYGSEEETFIEDNINYDEDCLSEEEIFSI